tara:strand:- start:88 stop:240 length:153 start_codon:yes stop_codon:yes gene_type:complete
MSSPPPGIFFFFSPPISLSLSLSLFSPIISFASAVEGTIQERKEFEETDL